jgi:eukaryotic-like serine/threonine-protein kinase
MPEIREGTIIDGRFEIRRCLGGGGFGTVWHAFDSELEREVAIKRLNTPSKFHAVNHEEVIEEARKIALLTHPNIVSVYDVLQYQREPLIIMEYLSGGSLHDYLRDRSRNGKWITAVYSVRVVKGILLGLNAAHNCERGPIIHKDLKPLNILFDRLGQPKIADFGLAVIGAVPEINTVHPGKWAHSGTLGYMSPEQLRGAQMDQRSDLFNVGLISYLLFAAIHPFTDQRFLFDYGEMLIEPYRALQKIDGDNLPPEISDFIITLLAADPESRFHDTREALSELELVEAKFQELTLQRSLNLLRSVESGEVAVAPTSEELAESILLCKRKERYEEGIQLYEKSGVDFSDLSEHEKARLEEDYRVCKRRTDRRAITV